MGVCRLAVYTLLFFLFCKLSSLSSSPKILTLAQSLSSSSFSSTSVPHEKNFWIQTHYTQVTSDNKVLGFNPFTSTANYITIAVKERDFRKSFQIISIFWVFNSKILLHPIQKVQNRVTGKKILWHLRIIYLKHQFTFEDIGLCHQHSQNTNVWIRIWLPQ